MSMRRGRRLAMFAFFATWIPLSVWRGLAQGRSFRIGHTGADATGPLLDGVVQLAAVMLAPALFVALIVFVLWAWREEHRRS